MEIVYLGKLEHGNISSDNIKIIKQILQKEFIIRTQYGVIEIFNKKGKEDGN